MTIKLKIDGREMQISQEEALLFIRIGDELKQIQSLKHRALYGAAQGTQTMTDRVNGPSQKFSSRPAPADIQVQVLADC